MKRMVLTRKQPPASVGERIMRTIKKTLGLRAYAQAAVVDRLTYDFRTSSASPNQEVKADIRELRRRARALYRDDPYVSGLIREYVQNIIGEEGLIPHPKNESAKGGLSLVANDNIVEAWNDWGHAENASTDRMLSWREIEELIVAGRVVDGEVFIRLRKGFPNDYGFAVELVDPDLLDEQFNVANVGNGNSIAMGVELDKWNAPVAYHFWTAYPNEPGIMQRRRERVAADEVIHWYGRKRPGQVRGTSELTPIIFRLKMLGAYEDAEVTASRISASKMGILEVDPNHLEGWDPQAAGERVEMDVSPGSFEQLPPGYKLTPFDPQHPTTAFTGFVKAILRSIAVGGGVAYTTLTGDLEAVNYSSIRAGLLSERDHWKREQKGLAEKVHRRVFGAWLDVAVLTPKLSLPSRKSDRWKNIEWRGRGWKWVDPYNEMRSVEMAVALGLKSRQQACAELGVDFETVLIDLAHENDLAKKYDVTIAGMAAKSDSPQPIGSEDDLAGAPASDPNMMDSGDGKPAAQGQPKKPGGKNVKKTA